MHIYNSQVGYVFLWPQEAPPTIVPNMSAYIQYRREQTHMGRLNAASEAITQAHFHTSGKLHACV